MGDPIHDIKVELIEFKAQAHYWKAQYEKSLETRKAQEARIKVLEGQVSKLNQKLYGKKSEKHNPKKTRTPSRRIRGQQSTNKQPKRRRYDHLPTETEVYEFEEGGGCPCCGKPFADFGFSEETEVLEVEVKPYKRRIIRRKAKKTCLCDGGPQLITAPGPHKLIPRSKLGLSIWIELLVSKFHFGQPINRTLNSFALKDMDLPQGTVTGGLRNLVDLFTPIVDAIRTRCLQANFWHADETRWSVFEKILGKESTRWYLWLFESEDAAMFIIDPTRATDVILDFFGTDSCGTLMVDRYSAYQCYVKKNPNMHLAFCWAHIRREFLDYTKEAPELEDWAIDWVDRIRRLYEDRSTVIPMKGTVTRQLNSGKLCHGQKRLLSILKDNWAELTRFVTDPDLPIDNNEAERTLRTPVVGRKNFFGSGAIWSSKLSAQCYSIFKTLSMNGINIHQWLQRYFEVCARNGGRPPEDVSRFLPWESSVRANSPPVKTTKAA